MKKPATIQTKTVTKQNLSNQAKKKKINHLLNVFPLYEDLKEELKMLKEENGQLRTV